MVQPYLRPPGGGNGVAAWMIESLKDDYALTLLTAAPVDHESINRHYGTTLAPNDFEVTVCDRAAIRMIDAMPMSLTLLRNCLITRRTKRIAGDFDAVI